MKRRSTLSVIREIQIKTAMRKQNKLIRKTKIKKTTISSVREDVEQLDHGSLLVVTISETC